MIYRIVGKLLHESPAVRDRVAARIFFEHAPANTHGECIIIRSLAGVVNDHLQNESGMAHARLQVDCYAASVTESHSLYQAVRNLLSGFSGSVEFLADDGEEETTLVSACNMLRPGALVSEPRDGSDRWSYRYTADFEVFHTQAVPTHV